MKQPLKLPDSSNAPKSGPGLKQDRNDDLAEVKTQRHESRRQISIWGILTAISLLITAAMALVMAAVAVRFNAGHFWNRDTLEYWAAGKLFVEGGNPYDVASIFQLEKSAGSDYAEVAMNPPIILGFVAPLGFFSARGADLLWLMLMLASTGLSIWILWNLGGRRSWLEQLLCLCFAPIIACIMIGQSGIFLLLGVMLFLAFQESRPFFAGLALLVCALKPHLFVPFGIVLLLWVVSRRRYSLLAGFGAGLLCALAVAYVVDPHAWSQWQQFMHAARPAETPVQNLSRVFRNVLAKDVSWFQFVPVAGASVWAIWYFRSRQERWNWLDQGLLLLIVSVGCAPYSWLTDEAVLLPAVIAGVWRASENRRTLLPLVLFLAAPLFQMIRGQWILGPYFVWTVPAWFAWYLFATLKRKSALRLETAPLSN